VLPVWLQGKHPPQLKIVEDPNRVLIDRASAMGVPMNRVAARFGYDLKAISRYRNRMPQQLKAALVAAALKPKEADLDQLRIDENEGILGNLAHQRARLLVVQDECMEDDLWLPPIITDLPGHTDALSAERSFGRQVSALPLRAVPA
jgi:hypothetical protein